ncbi:hypothetical protein KDI_19840 [Dictyobacter arantiisoli]|uniref:Uncharacterized protein n=1 Tax=Dictyobacter arantiisoli TaxID=2014874 RepID=A0A5A5TA80_9CHLR|nr:hypothetical protein KDI_19840 [Dictyobacter arantiisoli]
MKPNLDRVQIILGGVFFLCCITFELFFVLGKLRIANGVANATMLVFIIGCFYTGFKRISQARKEGVTISWHKERWIRSGIIIFICQILVFISNYGRIYG